MARTSEFLRSLRWYIKVTYLKLKNIKITFWTPDRLYLEYKLLYYCYLQKPKRLLFIGIDSYTSFYHELFSATNFYTLDADPEKSHYGSALHLAIPLSKLNRHINSHYFQCIIMNGVYGWGINSIDQLNDSFEKISDVLTKGGIFIFGYNNVSSLDPLKFENIYENLLLQYNFSPCKIYGQKIKALKKLDHHTYYYFIKN